VIEHTETCPVYDNGPCDCGVDEHMTDEQIDFELFEKEAAKIESPSKKSEELD
jgi:hypothetical protein